MSADDLRSPAIRKFLDRPRFATIATIDPSGAPFTAVVWYSLGDSTITVNSSAGRRWPANLRRDPRIAFTAEAGYNYVTVLGRVTIDDDQVRAQQNMAEIAAKYLTDPKLLAQHIADYQTQQRIIFEIHPETVLAKGEPFDQRSLERS
jgi:PPOX class probable F420-dependent enzyme